jgi:hypothetical protein
MRRPSLPSTVRRGGRVGNLRRSSLRNERNRRRALTRLQPLRGHHSALPRSLIQPLQILR